MTFDPERWRSETPAASAGRIHLNNAGAALMPAPVIDAVHRHLQNEVRLGGYEAADAAQREIEASYMNVAILLGCEPRNVAFVENATVAFSQALSACDFAPGDVILTTANDYVSNQLMFLSLARRLNVRVVRAADLPEGGVDPQSVRERIAAERPKLVAASWIPTNSGLIQPVEELGAICAESGVPFLLDACQAVGQLPMDVARLNCDFLAATSRKFLRGPRGAGFLYVSDRALDEGRAPLLVDMRGADWTAADEFALFDGARRFENWEFAYALLIGTGVAAGYACQVGIDAAGAYAAELAAYCREKLQALPGARVLDRGARLCAIVTVAIAGHDPQAVMERLRDQAINTSVTGRSSAVIDMDRKGAAAALRISPHYYNTKREIDAALWALEEFTGPPD
jgi:selenocysteine lyase/cysteine desulfurase